MSNYQVYICLAMCPKCGHARRENERGMICSFCETRMISVDYPADQYHSLKNKGMVHERLMRQYIRNSPQYSKASEEARMKKDNQDIVEAMCQRHAAPSPTPTLTTCPVCQGKLSTAATACPHCGQPMSNGQIAQPQTPPKVREVEDTTPRCPTCKSKNIKQLTPFDRGLSIFVHGRWSDKFNKSMKCLNCGYTW